MWDSRTTAQQCVQTLLIKKKSSSPLDLQRENLFLCSDFPFSPHNYKSVGSCSCIFKIVTVRNLDMPPLTVAGKAGNGLLC